MVLNERFQLYREIFNAETPLRHKMITSNRTVAQKESTTSYKNIVKIDTTLNHLDTMVQTGSTGETVMTPHFNEVVSRHVMQKSGAEATFAIIHTAN